MLTFLGLSGEYANIMVFFWCIADIVTCVTLTYYIWNIGAKFTGSGERMSENDTVSLLRVLMIIVMWLAAIWAILYLVQMLP